jgi:hypothetical protein
MRATKPDWPLSVKVGYYLADKVARVHFSRPFVQCLISTGLTEEECLQEVTNGNNVPESSQQAAVSPSTSCQSLIFTNSSTFYDAQTSSIEERST